MGLMSSHESLKVEEGDRKGDQSDTARGGLSPLLLVLKVEDGGLSQEMLVASKIWKRQGEGFPQQPPEGHAALPMPCFSPGRPVLDL